MALVICGFFPFLGIIAAGMKGVLAAHETSGGDAYARAGNAATEALLSIRTVAAFGGERAEVAPPLRYLRCEARDRNPPSPPPPLPPPR